MIMHANSSQGTRVGCGGRINYCDRQWMADRRGGGGWFSSDRSEFEDGCDVCVRHGWHLQANGRVFVGLDPGSWRIRRGDDIRGLGSAQSKFVTMQTMQVPKAGCSQVLRPTPAPKALSVTRAPWCALRWV